MCTVDLDNRLDNTLFHTLHSIKLFIQDSPCLNRIDCFKIIVLPLDIQHNRKSPLCMMALFLGNFTGSCHCQISSGPESDIIRQCFACAGHKIGNTLNAGKLHLITVFLLFLILFCLSRCITLQKSLNHKLQKAILCRKLCAAAKSSFANAVYRISVLPVSTRQTYIDPAVSQPFQKTGKSGINFHHICCMVTVFFLKIKSSTVYRIGKHTAGMMFPLSLFIVKHHDRLLR